MQQWVSSFGGGGGVGIGAITDAGSGTWGQGVVGLPQCMRGAEVGGKPKS